MRLLALCPIGIGNFLLLTPALKTLHEQRPQTEIWLLALRGEIAKLAERFPFIKGSIRVDVGTDRRPGALLPLFRQLRGFDLSIAFFPGNRLEYNLLPFLARAKKRIGFAYATRTLKSGSFLNTARMPVNAVHDLVQNFAPLKALGIETPPDPAMLPFPLTGAERRFADQWIQQYNSELQPLIGMHPGSSADHTMDKKRWPANAFGDLGRKILSERKAKFLVFGGPGEERVKNEAAKGIGAQAVAVQTGTLGETAALIARCQKFISNDSGLMHVAVSAGVPTAGIFGPTDDLRTAPFGPGNLVIRQGLECSPCWTVQNVGRREHCKFGDFRCLRNYPADAVYEKLRNWLGNV